MINRFLIDSTNAPIMKYIRESMKLEDRLTPWQIQYFTTETKKETIMDKVTIEQVAKSLYEKHLKTLSQMSSYGGIIVPSWDELDSPSRIKEAWVTKAHSVLCPF